MTFKQHRKWILAALCGVAISISSPMFQSAFAQSHSGGQGAGGHTTETDHGDDHGEGGKKLMRGGSAQRGGGHGSLRDVFNEMEEEAVENPIGRGVLPGAKKQTGKPAVTGGHTDTEAAEGEEEDSDRPPFAGTPGPKENSRANTEPGSKRGDIYGDMYVVLRNEDGIPELDGDLVKVAITDADGNTLYQYTDDNGNIVYTTDPDADPNTELAWAPRDSEGDFYTKEIDGVTHYYTSDTYEDEIFVSEVELGRLSVGRSPIAVLAAQYDDAITTINDAVSVEYDDAGRIVATMDDGTVKTIDSPLANLALYYELLNEGTLTAVDADKLEALGIVTDDAISADELVIAASFFGASSDKTIAISEDSIEYMNLILSTDGTIVDADGNVVNADGTIVNTSGDDLLDGNYVDYSSVSYVPADHYDVNVLYLEIGTDADGQPTSNWVPTNLLDVLGYDADGADPTTAITNIEGFTAAADDARQIIDFFHEYTVVPAPTE